MKTIIGILVACWALTYCQSAIAVGPSGYVIEWGWNTSTGRAVPARLVIDDSVAVSAGRFHRVALKNDGTVVEWVADFQGEMPPRNTILTSRESGFTDQ